MRISLGNLVRACLLLVSLKGYSMEPLSISDAYIRMAPPGAPAAAYFTVHNNSDKVQTIVAFDAPWAGMIMLHESSQQNGVAQMRHLDVLSIAAHAQAVLQPGGMHLMLMEVTTLKENEVRELILRTQDGVSIKVMLTVRRP